MGSGMTRPEIECQGCGDAHYMSPAGMAIVILAFMRGIMQVVDGAEIVPKCLLAAFDDEDITRLYKGRNISITTEPRKGRGGQSTDVQL